MPWSQVVKVWVGSPFSIYQYTRLLPFLYTFLHLYPLSTSDSLSFIYFFLVPPSILSASLLIMSPSLMDIPRATRSSFCRLARDCNRSNPSEIKTCSYWRQPHDFNTCETTWSSLPFEYNGGVRTLFDYTEEGNQSVTLLLQPDTYI